MGIGAFGASILGGFADAARQRQQFELQKQYDEYNRNLSFWESVAKDPRTNPAYLPQIISGISQLHGLQPGKKDHDALMRVTQNMSNLLQGGQGAPTDTYNVQGFQPTQQNQNPVPQTSQPSQGAMVSPQASNFAASLPPIPQVGGLTNLNAGPGDITDPGQITPEVQPGVQQFALPPIPQLMTASGQRTPDQTITKAQPAFINPYAQQLPYREQLAGFTAGVKGEQSRQTYQLRNQLDMERDLFKYKDIGDYKSKLEKQHDLAIVNREVDQEMARNGGDKALAQETVLQRHNQDDELKAAKIAETKNLVSLHNQQIEKMKADIDFQLNKTQDLQQRRALTEEKTRLDGLKAMLSDYQKQHGALLANAAYSSSPDMQSKATALQGKIESVIGQIAQATGAAGATSPPPTRKGKPSQTVYQAGQTITGTDGKKYKVTGVNPKTGNPIVVPQS